MNPKIVNVTIGQLKMAGDGEELHTILGSCVGIGLIWKSKRICALAHCLLPVANKPSPESQPAKFVDQAIPLLVKMLGITPFEMPFVEAVIVGGGHMTGHSPHRAEQQVGPANAEAALRLMGKTGIRIIFQDLGGNTGRKLVLNCAEGTFRTEKIPRLESA